MKSINYVDILLELKKIARIQCEQKEFMRITGAGSYRKIDYSEIYYIEILNHTVTVHTKTEEIGFRGSLKDVENKGCRKRETANGSPFLSRADWIRTMPEKTTAE